MLIDWFTVSAQALNFLILVWLLKRFLYRPVLAAIEAREKKIAAQLASATQREAQARADREDVQRRRESLEREREGILGTARTEAAAERQRLSESARHDAELLRAKLAESIAKERSELGRRWATQTQTEVFALARKVLADLAGAGIEERMVEVFIGNLRRLPQDQRGVAEGGARQAALVRTAFELSLPQRAAIKAAVTDSLGPDISLRFEITPDLVCGIDISVNGTKYAWSIADYLTAASQELIALIDAPRGSTQPSLETRHG